MERHDVLENMSPQSEELNASQGLYVVALLDLLGYGDLVNEFQEKPEVIEGIESVFAGTLKLMEGIKSAPLGERSAAWRLIAERISCRLISDTAIITMPFADLPKLSEDMNPTENTAICMEAFLDSVCPFFLMIAGKTGYFFRGGIALNQHYESASFSNRNLFVFSKAIVEAATLMKKEQQSGMPRILLTDCLVQSLQGSGPDNPLEQDGWIFAEEGHWVLSVYNAIPAAEEYKEKTSRLLSDIRSGLQGQVKKHGHGPDVAKKYRWLVDYHNKQTSERLHCSELTIAI